MSSAAEQKPAEEGTVKVWEGHKKPSWRLVWHQKGLRGRFVNYLQGEGS